ncbi:LytTR family DNA-binding domain-containing protein [Paenibacillus arenosi]|uniref:LytTR family transcriptional regulator n=1 Tax=Paenibacillus arenosi TaxID=2774142 RepID=A0ABR9B0Y7_9BACL|nr:LytTR family DNA-binding domain-containing protein [Paenibacillus arenosi]MBD8500056.1 LytTR family transcriptional regulator [Paenibacillus arenosi]
MNLETDCHIPILVFSPNCEFRVRVSEMLKEYTVTAIQTIEKFRGEIKKQKNSIAILEVTEKTAQLLERLLTIKNEVSNVKFIYFVNLKDIEALLSLLSLNPSSILPCCLDENVLRSNVTKVMQYIYEQGLACVTKKNLKKYNFIQLTVKNKQTEIIEDLIMFIEKKGKYNVEIYLSNGGVITSTTNLKDISTQSTPYLFQSHKSFLVNIKYTHSVIPNSFNNYDLTLSNQTIIPLSKSYYPIYNVAKTLLKADNTYSVLKNEFKGFHI